MESVIPFQTFQFFSEHSSFNKTIDNCDIFKETGKMCCRVVMMDNYGCNDSHLWYFMVMMRQLWQLHAVHISLHS